MKWPELRAHTEQVEERHQLQWKHFYVGHLERYYHGKYVRLAPAQREGVSNIIGTDHTRLVTGQVFQGQERARGYFNVGHLERS